MGRKRNAYRLLAGKPERRRPLERLRLTWKAKSKIDLKEIGWEGVDLNLRAL
jgi:hypothetical protein